MEKIRPVQELVPGEGIFFHYGRASLKRKGPVLEQRNINCGSSGLSLVLSVNFLKSTDKFARVEANSGRDIEIFKDIESPFSKFIFGHVGRGLAQPLGNLRLGQSVRLARGDQKRTQAAVPVGVNWFGHQGAFCCGSSRENPLVNSPKIGENIIQQSINLAGK